MKNFVVIAGLLLTFWAGVPGQVRTVEDLNWLAGCWESNEKDKNLLLSEQWMKPAGGMMLGIGRTVKNGKATGFEFMRIAQTGNDIFFVAKPHENKEDTFFKLIRSGKFEVVFENSKHDFPQRVIYRGGATKLTGRIEGTTGGKFSSIDFPMSRTRCE